MKYIKTIVPENCEAGYGFTLIPMTEVFRSWVERQPDVRHGDVVSAELANRFLAEHPEFGVARVEPYALGGWPFVHDAAHPPPD